MKLTPLGDAAVLIELGDDPKLIRRWVETLAAAKLDGVNEIVPSYSTVTVFYEPATVARLAETEEPFSRVVTWLTALENELKGGSHVTLRELVIPVCYEGEYAPDLGVVMTRAGLSADEVIGRHSEATYEVRAVGFSPGFPYLSGLPTKLETPRQASPRASVPAGSVGIGGAQTGIYPIATPGGWNLIGRTPLRLFDPMATEPALLRVGDRIRFERITKNQFENWTA